MEAVEAVLPAGFMAIECSDWDGGAVKKFTGVGMAIGIGVGTAVGVATHNLATWIGIGAAIGVVVSFAMNTFMRKSK